MRPRNELQMIFEDLLGTRNVYFQPPSEVKMKYPCIRYERDADQTDFADNLRYYCLRRYNVVVISTDPEESVCEEILELPYSSFDRSYTADNLNHTAFKIYF